MRHALMNTAIDSVGQVFAHDQTPWASISKPLPKDASVKDTLDIAGLNWKVQKTPIFTEVVVADPTHPSGSRVQRIKIKDSFALVRTNDHAVLSPYMGNRYKPIDNVDAFEVFEQFTRHGGMTMETAGSLHGGKYVWGLASLGDGFELANGEVIKGYFLLVQSHSYGNSLRALFTPIRFPGGHTIVQAINRGGSGGGVYTMSHSRVFNDARIEEIKQVVGIARSMLGEFHNKAKFLASAKLSEQDKVYYVTELMNPTAIKQKKLSGEKLPTTMAELASSEDANRRMNAFLPVMSEFPGSDMPTCDGTAWGLYQAVNSFVDREMGHGVDTRLESAWFGKGADLKNKALDLAVTMATKSKL